MQLLELGLVVLVRELFFVLQHGLTHHDARDYRHVLQCLQQLGRAVVDAASLGALDQLEEEVRLHSLAAPAVEDVVDLDLGEVVEGPGAVREEELLREHLLELRRGQRPERVEAQRHPLNLRWKGAECPLQRAGRAPPELIAVEVYGVKLRRQRLERSHEWGADANYAVFGRYSYRSGGESEDVNNPALETPVKHGGFVGLAWNRPFNRADEQLAAAFVYGEPADYKIADGFNSQYGVEVFWNWRATDWLKILPNVQFMRNIDDDIETIIGIRVNMGFQRSWQPGAP